MGRWLCGVGDGEGAGGTVKSLFKLGRNDVLTSTGARDGSSERPTVGDWDVCLLGREVLMVVIRVEG